MRVCVCVRGTCARGNVRRLRVSYVVGYMLYIHILGYIVELISLIVPSRGRRLLGLASGLLEFDDCFGLAFRTAREQLMRAGWILPLLGYFWQRSGNR